MMTDLTGLLAVLTGIAVRLLIPILVTMAAVYFLRKLDAHWRAEGRKAPTGVMKPACWEIMGCSPARRKNCPGFVSALPCWQARRAPDGYLREQCLSCKVFLKAPAPSLG
jgi:hypothetical protein